MASMCEFESHYGTLITEIQRGVQLKNTKRPDS